MASGVVEVPISGATMTDAWQGQCSVSVAFRGDEVSIWPATVEHSQLIRDMAVRIHELEVKYDREVVTSETYRDCLGVISAKGGEQ